MTAESTRDQPLEEDLSVIGWTDSAHLAVFCSYALVIVLYGQSMHPLE